jgi:acyl-CoA reductase-like NAD-dependent aldehyde dehydrogenase
MTTTANSSTRHVRSLNPATGETVHDGPAATPEDVAVAVGRATAAQPGWAAAPVAERAAVLHRFAALVDRDAEALARLIVAEMGKRRAEAEGEVAWTSQSARWYADHPPAAERAGSAWVRRTPLGVVAVVTPWNVPLLGGAWKWLPALVAGNAVVWKASELTPAVAVQGARLLAEAGLPDGALELVLGGGEAGRALVGDERVAGVHFTGSTATGRRIAATVAPRLVPCALELGGLNPVVVFEDADLDHAADCVVAAGTSINGQKCSATRRVLVAEPVASRLADALADRVSGLAVGDPADPRTDLGPLVTAAASGAAAEALAGARRRGAALTARSRGGDREEFFAAALLTDVAPGDPLASHELFAPVMTLERFGSDSDAWTRANATPYGLTAAVHTRDPDRIAAAPDRLAAGVVNINRRGDAVDLQAPFGGVGASGNGYPEGGRYVYSSLTSAQACYGYEPR